MSYDLKTKQICGAMFNLIILKAFIMLNIEKTHFSRDHERTGYRSVGSKLLVCKQQIPGIVFFKGSRNVGDDDTNPTQEESIVQGSHFLWIAVYHHYS